MSTGETTVNPQRWKIMHVINLGTFMTTLDVGIVHLALPQVAEQFGANLGDVQWVITAYLLTMIGLLPILGGLSDRLERRVIYSFGMFGFGLGSLLAVFAGQLWLLIAARVVQGIGATMMMANSQAMVRAVFPDNERGKALGLNTVFMSAGTLAGPAIGGFLSQWGGWPLLFLINVPFAAAATYYGLRLFPQTERSQRKLDTAGALVLAAAATLLFAAAIMAQEQRFSAPVLIVGAAGLLAAAALWRIERRREHAIVDSILYRNRHIGIGNLSNFLYYAAQTGTQLPLSFYLLHGLGLSVSSAGLVLAVQPVLMGLSGPLSGWARDRFGPAWPTTAGMLICAASTVPVAAGGAPTLADLIAFNAMFGLGTGLFLAANNATIMSAAPGSKASLVGSMLALIRYLGMVGGIALAVLLIGAGATDASAAAQAQTASGLRWLFAASGCICLAVALIGRWRGERARVAATP
ncbi:MAG: MFS transporter [Paenibacillaceae bacterium]|nr:MFS transporter [Paenibacillaceae bacterium]